MPAMVYVTSSNNHVMVGLIDQHVRKYYERIEQKGMGVCVPKSLERLHLKRMDHGSVRQLRNLGIQKGLISQLALPCWYA